MSENYSFVKSGYRNFSNYKDALAEQKSETVGSLKGSCKVEEDLKLGRISIIVVKFIRAREAGDFKKLRRNGFLLCNLFMRSDVSIIREIIHKTEMSLNSKSYI
jgi:hypothetical protein